MTLIQNPDVARPASLDALTDRGDPNAKEGFEMKVDVEIDVSNDDTVVMHRASSPRPRLVVPTRTTDRPTSVVAEQLDAIKRSFHESSYGDLQKIEVTRQGETICLSGSLPSFFLKQTAQEIVRQQDSDRPIVNRIQVGEA